VRPLPLLLALALAGPACRSGQQLPGAPFAGAGLLAPLSEAEEAHDALMHADVTRADSVARLGYAAGMGTMLTDDVLYLRGGLPALRGRAAALAVVAAESAGAATTVRWQPVRVEASRDGGSGYSYGYAISSSAGPSSAAPSLRVDRYIAFWRREAEGWRIAAYAETYGAPPPALTLPAGARNAVLPDVAMRAGRGPLESVRSADVEFSRVAGREGAGQAFGHFAADDAQIFSGPGELTSGPQAITRSFGAASDGSTMAWHPIAGEVSRAGDLGFTIGNAVFTGRRGDGAPEVRYSKYLTVWKRQPDGGWRYVVDGGSARPDQ
jgi:ketosteroid isomerase-like protein